MASPANVTRHPTYYRVDGHPKFYAIFLVEDALFCLNKDIFTHGSSFFRDMFTIAHADASEGASDDNPIRIEGVTQPEFATFVAFLLWDTKWFTFDKVWFPVLKLASMWLFENIKEHILEEISKCRLTSAQRLRVAAFFPPVWYRDTISTLCEQLDPLNAEIHDILGTTKFLALCEARDKYRTSVAGSMADDFCEKCRVEVKSTVQRALTRGNHGNFKCSAETLTGCVANVRSQMALCYACNKSWDHYSYRYLRKGDLGSILRSVFGSGIMA